MVKTSKKNVGERDLSLKHVHVKVQKVRDGDKMIEIYNIEEWRSNHEREEEEREGSADN